MKSRLLYFSVALFLLGLASCTKQDIRPNTDTETTEPVWKSRRISIENLDGFDGVSNPITDPNEDPEESRNNKK